MFVAKWLLEALMMLIRIGCRIGSDLRTLRTLENLIFEILEPPAVQKYSTCWVFLAFCHKLYLYICEFVFVYLTVGNISLMSLDPGLFKNIARFYKVFSA